FSPKFAQQLLHLVVNQAGQERWFSDFSNKKEQEAQSIEPQKNGPSPTGEGSSVTRFIGQEQKAEGLTDERTKRRNHEDSRVQQLLTVPRYAERY
ncbi:hypothetical protein R3P38DRAFT_2894289, partial [Favolaschia claudopus]